MKQALLEKVKEVYNFHIDEKNRLYEVSMDGKIVLEENTPETFGHERIGQIFSRFKREDYPVILR